MTATAEQTGAWLEKFATQPAAEPWMQALRETAFAEFTKLGFPTTHDEEWRFTNVAPIARGQFAVATKVANDGSAAPFAGGTRIVFVNGLLAEAPAELPKGVALSGLTSAEAHLGRYITAPSAFTALNTAFLGEGAYLQIARGAVVEEPIHLVYISAGNEPQAAHPRTLVVVGPDAHCTLIQSFVGDAGASFTNPVTEIVAGAGAVVDHYDSQLLGHAALHVGSLFASLGRSANFSSTSVSLGAALSRHDINVTLSEGSDAALNGLYVVNGSQHVDYHTALDHSKPHGTSREVYKGVLDGEANAVFNGRVLVRQDAQKTDSKQTNKNLVLSDRAVVNTKPELQIFADDVRCTHGATIGQLDAESLFYLQSRGIGKSDARNLLTYAFAQDVVDGVKYQPLRDSLERVLFEKFNERAR